MKTIEEIKEFATKIRIETIRCIKQRGFGHIGGSMSIADVLAVLYGNIMKYDPKDPAWKERDYLVVSKGHAGPALFAALALKGFFPVEWLATLSEPGTRLPSHCDRLRTPGVDVSTGSLGQGLSITAGIAQVFGMRKQENRVYAILGDGECAEGQIWEAAQYASHYKLNRLVAFVDWNKRQVDGYLEDIMSVGDIAEKFEAFGWMAAVVDGGDVRAIQQAVLELQKKQADRPAVVVLDGIKGSGVPEFEQMEYNHHFALTPELADKVIADLEKQMSKGEI
ncbi:transketolase [Christensenella minuta]|uniref:transketolase n=1 Tax=Christensenella minuta TaxID=626937 RepID=UPI002A7F2182|nr:transketolase [Christensenella minuta]MDY3751257.1 transketolase [Christensenella minuta]